jgi:alkylated DNA repair dioxygenase AlkB
MQLSFLDCSAPNPDATFDQAQHFELGDGAWLESVPGWLAGHNEAFELLRACSDWEQHRRLMYERIVTVPRLVASMPGSGVSLRWADEVIVKVQPHIASNTDLERCTGLLRTMAALLSKRYRRALSHVSLAYYRDGNDSVAFHGDKLGALRANTIVAIVSVGSRRKFLLRPAAKSGARDSLSFTVGEGDLLVMGGSCQETWEHAVPKSAHAGPRIAIMFREAVPAMRVAAAYPMPLEASAQRATGTLNDTPHNHTID